MTELLVIILGVLFAALLVRALHLTPSVGELLDAVAPGLTLCLALIRLSSLFNTNCRGRIVIADSVYQRLPFAVSWTDAAGNIEFRLATFFLEFIAFLIITVILCGFFFRHRSEPLWEGARNEGNVWRLLLILVGVVEIIADSTRYDSALMHFFLIKRLNPYASFISIASGFSQSTCFPAFAAAMQTGACPLFQVQTSTASMSAFSIISSAEP